MKKNVLIFGLVSGIILTGIMLFMVARCINNPEFESNDFLGYTALVAAFAFIFVGIRNYRNNYLGGVITFGQAVKTGVLISAIASGMYVAVWLVDYYVFVPGYLDSYTAHVLYKAKVNGASEAELAETSQKMAEFKELYKNPLFVIIVSFLEVFPIGLVVTLVSAWILKRKRNDAAVVNA